jgi:hypothetical protein
MESMWKSQFANWLPPKVDKSWTLIHKLSGACYAVRSVCHIINTDTEINLFCLFSLYTEVWNNFWGGNSSNIKNIFSLQKKIVLLIAGVKQEFM